MYPVIESTITIIAIKKQAVPLKEVKNVGNLILVQANKRM